VEAYLALERVAVRWTRWLALAGGFVLLAVALLTVADALLRKFWSRPIQGTFEATELLLAAIIFFAMPYTGLVDGHVSVDFLTGRLSRRGQQAVLAVNALVCAAVLGIIAWRMGLLAAEYARTARTTITMRIPVLPFIVPVTATAWLAAVSFALQAAAALVRVARPDLPDLGTSGPR
jgi:TRAP-type mannitol/chloroaromatic compound transport system permease small subunit